MSREIIYPIKFKEDILDHTAADNDAVMNDLRTKVTEIFNEWFGTSHTPDGITAWNTIEQWAITRGLSREDAEHVQEVLFYNDYILFSAGPLPGAVEFMREAYRRGHQIPVYSSRYPRQDYITKLWYRIYMPFVLQENIHVSLEDLPREVHKSWMISRASPEPKKLFLEDSHSHAEFILNNTDASVVYLSNDTSLDGYLGSRLFRIGSEKGKAPNLWPLYEAFFGKRP